MVWPTLSDGKTCKGSKPWLIFDSPFVSHPATDPHLQQKKIDGAYSTMAHLNHIENYRTNDISGITNIKWTDMDLVDFYNASMEWGPWNFLNVYPNSQTPSTASRLRSQNNGTTSPCPIRPHMRMLTLISYVIPAYSLHSHFFSNLSHKNRRLADYHNSPQANCASEPHASASWQAATFSQISAIISKYGIYISRNGILLLTLASF